MNEFIATCSFEGDGSEAEEIVWERLKDALKKEDLLAYYQYPLFSNKNEVKRQPDIVIFHRQWGVIVIEVKGLLIDQVESVKGGKWEVKDYFNKPFINPGKQVEAQVELLMKKFTSRILCGKIPVRIAIALPYITRWEWEKKGFGIEDQPILFKDNLTPKALLMFCENLPLLYGGRVLDDEQWNCMLSKVGGIQETRIQDEQVCKENTKAFISHNIENQIHKLDIQQERISKVIPPGPQRIRGIAGSGKTILLCQRAVHMHLKYPEWKIAIVFWTKSLYNTMYKYIKRYIDIFTEGEIHYNPDGNLKIYHAWGGKGKNGLYSEIAKLNSQHSFTVNELKQQGIDSYGFFYACQQLLESTKGQLIPYYNAILIDEGQDLIGPSQYKYNEKQPFYWMAYQSIKPLNNGLRCMSWAYDEFQDLNTLKIPSYKEIFGKGDTYQKLVKGPIYEGNINKSEVMKKCYRTPYQIFIAAHALGMGIFRKKGVLTCFTNKEEWEAIGYKIEQGGFNKKGLIKIKRPRDNNLNIIENYDSKDLISIVNFENQNEMYDRLADEIRKDIVCHKLQPSKDILIINLGYKSENKKIIQALNWKDINAYQPQEPHLNTVGSRFLEKIPDRFWMDDGVTIAQAIEAKGNEATMVYVVGVEKAFREDYNIDNMIKQRNQLFVSITRAKCWVKLMGVNISEESMSEINQAINCRGTFEFMYEKPKRIIDQE